MFFRKYIEKIKKLENEPFKEIMKGFEPIELNILEYTESRGSHIAPHFDDFWIWGERIIGLNLLEDTNITFYQTFQSPQDASPIDVQIQIPIKRRSIYLISRNSRFKWMHGIKQQFIKNRRIVCTLREIGEEYYHDGN